MARYVDAIDLPIPIEEAFDYLADFTRTAEWDPSVVDARKLTPGPIGRGTRFLVTVSFLGQNVALEYEIETYERPQRLVLHSASDSLDSFDVLTFAPTPTGARLTYVATLELSGLRRLADPVLHRLFQEMGQAAVRGLRERLAEKSESGAEGLPNSSRARAAAKRIQTNKQSSP